MSDTKVKELPEAQSVGANDLLYLVANDTDYKVKGSTVKNFVKPAVMSGATSIAPGSEGLAPAPAVGDNTKYFSGDGTYKQPALSEMADDATHRVVTDAEKGTWNAKQNVLTFDSAPTDGSTNPVTSDGIYEAIASEASARQTADEAIVQAIPTVVANPSGEATAEMQKLQIDSTIYKFATQKAYGEITNVDIASFSDGADDEPLAKLEVGIEAVQSGSGEPSPENVRPISGWSAVNVTRCGKNLIKLKDGTYSPVNREIKAVNGVMEYKVINTVALTYLLNQDAINVFFDNPKLKKGTYTFRVDTDAAFLQTPTFKLMFDDGTSVNNGDSITLDTEKTITSIALQASTALNAGTYYVNIQVEEGSSLSHYEPYNGTTYTIQLGDTYYGGNLDVTSGVLTVKYAIIDLGTCTWRKYSEEKPFFYADIPNIKQVGIGVIANILCTAYKTIAHADVYSLRDTGIAQYFNAYRVSLYDANYTDANALKTALSGVYLVYELLESAYTTIQLTPTQVKSLLKDNNIWADSGQIKDLVYVRDLNTYLKSLDDRITALENA